ncbi:MAG: phosphate ABC transporter substrate-binding protein PstS [Acidimicrobiales bacterium]
MAVTAIAAIAALSAACSSSSKTSTGNTTNTTSAAAGAKDSATLSGAGSTFVSTILQEWTKAYRSVAPGVTINYQPVGSGAGIQQLTSKTVDFAGSDVTLKPEEQQATGGPGSVAEVPWVAGAVAVEYNLPEMKNLKLSPATLAGIFAGKITKWNDAAIKADNQGASPPSTGISVVHRSDGSGTTQVFTEFLKATAPEVWTFGSGKDVPWPTGTGAKGSDGVTAGVKQSPGAIGYSELSFPKQASLGIASIKNKAGQFMAPTASAVTAALAGATVNPDLTLKLNYTPDDAAAYAMSTPTYLMFYKAGTDPAKSTALRHFAQWVLTDGQKLAAGLDYAPMPQSILDKALEVVRV